MPTSAAMEKTASRFRRWGLGPSRRGTGLNPAPPLTSPLPSLRGERATDGRVVVLVTASQPSPRNGERWPSRAAGGSVRGPATKRRARVAPLIRLAARAIVSREREKEGA